MGSRGVFEIQKSGNKFLLTGVNTELIVLASAPGFHARRIVIEHESIGQSHSIALRPQCSAFGQVIGVTPELEDRLTVKAVPITSQQTINYCWPAAQQEQVPAQVDGSFTFYRLVWGLRYRFEVSHNVGHRTITVDSEMQDVGSFSVNDRVGVVVVVYGSDGLLESGAEVICGSWREDRLLEEVVTITDIDGTCVLLVSHDGVHRISARNMGEISSADFLAGLEITEINNRLEIRLQPGVQLAGRVRDELGSPVSGIKVNVRERDQAGVRRTVHAQTNQLGEFRVDGLRRGTLHEVTVPLHPESLREVVTPDASVQIMLNPLSEIRFKVVSDEGELFESVPLALGSMFWGSFEPSDDGWISVPARRKWSEAVTIRVTGYQDKSVLWDDLQGAQVTLNRRQSISLRLKGPLERNNNTKLRFTFTAAYTDSVAQNSYANMEYGSDLVVLPWLGAGTYCVLWYDYTGGSAARVDDAFLQATGCVELATYPSTTRVLEISLRGGE